MAALLSRFETKDYVAAVIVIVGSLLCLRLLSAGRRRMARLVWVVVLVGISVPFTDLQGHTHWFKVGWIPFVTPPVKLVDIAANILLYFPIGYLQSSQHRTMRFRIALATGLALLIAFPIEVTQLYSHSRFPSSTDLVTDGIGAAIGSWFRWRRDSMRSNRGV